MALTLALPATAQDPTAAQCNDARLFTIEKKIFLGDGVLNEGASVLDGGGANGIQVNRMAGCINLGLNLMKEVPFCMNVWDTTPCTGGSWDSCPDTLATKVTGSEFNPATSCALMETGRTAQTYLVAATNNNEVRDNPTNRFIVALAVNPHQYVVFDIRDDD